MNIIIVYWGGRRKHCRFLKLINSPGSTLCLPEGIIIFLLSS